MVIGWIALTFSGCATQPLNQQWSNEDRGVRDVPVCRLELNEAPVKRKPDKDEPYRYEVETAVGLTGLMGGMYAEALGVHQVVGDQSEPSQTEPWPDSKGCIN
jgi:hypothetical protein